MYHIASIKTVIWCPTQLDYTPSATKGIILTLTAEIIAIPSPTELANRKCSPKVELNFGKMFDFEEGDSGEKESQGQHEDGAASPLP